MYSYLLKRIPEWRLRIGGRKSGYPITVRLSGCGNFSVVGFRSFFSKSTTFTTNQMLGLILPVDRRSSSVYGSGSYLIACRQSSGRTWLQIKITARLHKAGLYFAIWQSVDQSGDKDDNRATDNEGLISKRPTTGRQKFCYRGVKASLTKP